MNWLRTVLGALIAILVAVGIVVPLSTHLAPLADRQVFAVRGGSMAPAIPMGALIVVGDHGTDELAAGDVITWRGDNGVWVTHRIVRIFMEGSERFFQTQGDANAKPDGYAVPERAVIGSVDFWIPLAGFVLMILATPTGVVSWLSFAVALLIADSLVGGGKASGTTWPRLDWPMRRPAAQGPPTPAAVLAWLQRSSRRVARAASASASATATSTATGWPIHFEGVTLFGDDLALLDEMTRCAEGDHSRCVTDVRPRACLIATDAWTPAAPAADLGTGRSRRARLHGMPERASRGETVAWAGREVSRAAA